MGESHPRSPFLPGVDARASHRTRPRCLPPVSGSGHYDAAARQEESGRDLELPVHVCDLLSSYGTGFAEATDPAAKATPPTSARVASRNTRRFTSPRLLEGRSSREGWWAALPARCGRRA